jgi:predicted ATPase
VAWFDFFVSCAMACSQNDYIQTGQIFHTPYCWPMLSR